MACQFSSILGHHARPLAPRPQGRSCSAAPKAWDGCALTLPEHDPKWPDKVIFAAMLVVIAGALGATFAVLQLAGATIGAGVSSFLLITPPVVALPLCLAMIGLGVYAIRYQAAIWVRIAIGVGIASMGMLGVVPLLSLLAIVFLRMSRSEGEETVHDEHVMAASMWPDKALAASLLILVSAVVALFQAGLLFGANFTAPIFKANPSILGLLDLAIGFWGLYAAHEVFHLRRAWAGYVAGGLAVLSLGFWVFGPILGVGAIMLLTQAEAEREFVDEEATA